MGLFDKLFGGKKEDKELNAVFEKIKRLIDDEAYQIELLPPQVRDALRTRPAIDQIPDGTGSFGFSEKNPIPVNGPLGELSYLSRLETNKGERILFHRIGAIDKIDVFEAVTFSGSEWFILFVDFYYSRRSKKAPDGFHFTQDVPQFSGFHRYCAGFPYDFPEMKQNQRESGLSLAYMALGKIEGQLQGRKFQRPLSHSAKLELVGDRLTSSLEQS